MFCCRSSTKEDVEQRQHLLTPDRPTAVPTQVDYWKLVPPPAAIPADLQDGYVEDSVDLLIESSPADFVIEGANQKIQPDALSQYTSLQFPSQANHYQQYFKNQHGVETWGGLTQIGWVVLSMVHVGGETMLLVRDSYANALHRLSSAMALDQAIKEIKYPVDVNHLFFLKCSDDDVISLDEKLVIRSYKFGVLMCESNQKTEEEWYNNEHGTEGLERFLESLGEKIELKGWKGYRGGLDVTDGKTGDHAYYTEFQGNEIILHVSTLLPHSSADEQQISKKRYLGNDIVIFFFKEPGVAICPRMRSQFNHIFIVVEEDPNDRDRYLVNVARKHSVAFFGPPLPASFSIARENIREFLLSKALNAEWAAYRSKQFQKRLSTARMTQLEMFVEKYSK